MQSVSCLVESIAYSCLRRYSHIGQLLLEGSNISGKLLIRDMESRAAGDDDSGCR